MAKQEKAAKAEPKTRTIRTSEQRIADLEAQLAATRAKADAKKNKARNEAWAKRAKLIEQVNALTSKVEAIEKEFGTPDDHSAEDKADEPAADEQS